MKRFSLMLVAAGLCPAAAIAQSFNVDFNAVEVPAATLAGAAQQAGYWNAMDELPASPVMLLGLDGWLSGVSIDGLYLGDHSKFHGNDPQASGNFGRLMEDGLQGVNADAQFVVRVHGLQAGPYYVYTYADAPGRPDADSVVALGFPFPQHGQIVGGTYATNTFVQGVTHARHYVDLADGASLIMTVYANENINSPNPVLNGLQLRKLPRRLYVNSAATGAGDGLSWANAFTHFEDATAAAPTYGGAVTEIWVAGGVYRQENTVSRSQSFGLVDGVTIYGGFAGNETALQQRDPEAHPTIMSGSIGGPLPTDNSFHVFQSLGNDASAVLDGFTIQGGYASLNTDWDSKGGGMHIYQSSPTVRNCKFINNHAVVGGAVAISDGAPTFVNCLFYGNSATDEAGAIRYSNSALAMPLRVSHCRFVGNRTDGMVGALNLIAGNCLVDNCAFTGNDGALSTGALRVSGGSAVATVTNCTLVGNHGGSVTGGIVVSAAGVLNLNNSILWDNSATSLPAGAFAAQLANLSSSINTQYSCIQGSINLPGSSNIGQNPHFVNANGGDAYGNLNDDVRLAADSPLIDAGSNSLIGGDMLDLDGDGQVIEPVPFDLDFGPRRVDAPQRPDTGTGGAPLVDIGAYEFVPVAPADMNCDGRVDNFDIDPFVLAIVDAAAYAGAYPNCNIMNGDITQDGLFNNFDIDPFVVCIINGGCP